MNNVELSVLVGILVAVVISGAGVLWFHCRRKLIFSLVAIGSLVFVAAVTQINLATQVFGLLPGTNGGTGISSTATYPASGTIMTTATGVVAAQLPAPTASTLGGVESNITCTYGLASIGTAGGVTCNSAPTATQFNQGAPSGAINGSNTSFTLSPTPAASSNVNCFLNGLQQQQGAGDDYTISGATVTYLTAPPTGSKLNCLWY